MENPFSKTRIAMNPMKRNQAKRSAAIIMFAIMALNIKMKFWSPIEN